ncbi:MAG TPA: ubiquinone/menaquinone biosynthesis methyltransferase [Roseiflexaceae bacterium]|jgi:demethylmenaquinone methyltransferase/2-methoxy-6-polyprenyl-1,4-benzoquinol methylase|nr:ubiquinone/menaquinone biosynthesis methyltransferase [Roseiflexaceae bacterium]
MSVLPAPEQKAVYVERMFARIAPSYDRLNRLMTFGMDDDWRARAVEAIAPPAMARVLDVGCGTGAFLPLLAPWLPDGLAVGVDYTAAMLHAGQPNRERAGGRAAFVGGDALRLPFADESFDALTTGFVMRNVTDIRAAFREMWRVARPGALLACLEVARPHNPLLRAGHAAYFERVVPLLARAFGGDATAYTYLPQSARTFPSPDALAALMREAGWADVRYTLLGLGAVALHTARK